MKMALKLGVATDVSAGCYCLQTGAAATAIMTLGCAQRKANQQRRSALHNKKIFQMAKTNCFRC